MSNTILTNENYQSEQNILKPLYNKSGQLTIIFGPMFSGKTTKLINLYNYINNIPLEGWDYEKSTSKSHELDIIRPTTLVINYKFDTRYCDDKLSSHNKVMIPCIFAENLSEITDIVNKSEKDFDVNNLFINADFILINEAQFFTDIVDWVTIALNKYNKNIIICGLDSDFQRKSFGNWLDLITQSDNIIKLHAKCNLCNNKAIFTHRISLEKEQTVIGYDNYIPLCRKCYNNK